MQREQSLGELVKRERESRGLSQKELADMFKVSQTTIFYWENGTYEPSKRHIVAISEFLSMDVMELLQ